MSDFRFSTASIENMAGVDSRLIEIAKLALSISLIDFGIPQDGGLRTTDRQVELFAMSLSKCDGVVNPSEHQAGFALDFYAYVDGAASWDKGHLSHIAAAFLQAASILGYKLQWGGFWAGFPDFPHVQLLDTE